ncbi:nuclease-related domain-containing protein [Synechocystis sp. PCC 7509]|uniref:nuclease-related domain-containing protein n=1 Tax=Synechocystis sp. PCC 7509 TaxID=927677 RepID=UPI0002AD1732|nr:nuclease-related domain-containing protein [Synechocystis sp. PCC 7509]
MIVKELDPFIPQDKFAKAGKEAEQQMSFYLRRAFADDKNIYVFNDLRLEYEGDAAQIDHLIFHQYGMIIIESKSVSSRVEINEQQEWIRWFNNTDQGMASPIIQAREQGDFLKKYLNLHAEVLLSKILGMQHYFGSMPIDVLVAISDSGIIERPKKMSLEEVCKADQICDGVRSLLDKQQKECTLFSFNSPRLSFNKDEVNKVVAFLLKEHKPSPYKTEAETISKPNLQTSPPEKKVVIQAKSETPSILKPSKAILSQSVIKYSCRQCNKTNLSVSSGKYGYYFKCLECEGNTPINVLCPTCNNKEKIRKSGNQFFAECARCKTSDLFYTNSSS